MHSCSALFFFNDTATTEIYTLSLHDALPICDVDPSAAAAARLRDTRHRVSARAFEDRVDTLCRVPVAARAEPALAGASPAVTPFLEPDAEVYAALVLGLRDYVEKNGFDQEIGRASCRERE